LALRSVLQSRLETAEAAQRRYKAEEDKKERMEIAAMHVNDPVRQAKMHERRLAAVGLPPVCRLFECLSLGLVLNMRHWYIVKQTQSVVVDFATASLIAIQALCMLSVEFAAGLVVLAVLQHLGAASSFAR
jgi:hypothetical protein